jgi:hypothetical protein
VSNFDPAELAFALEGILLLVPQHGMKIS